jgi:phosphoribosylamine--glycine ligase
MKVLVVGGGGREHALCWKIKQSPLLTKLYCAPGNAGTAQIAENVELSAFNPGALAVWAVENKIDLTVVGPEAPLAEGLVNIFESHGLRVFGPTKEAAQLESSKSFSKEIMLCSHVKTPAAEIFSDYQQAKKYLESHGAPVVIKADGLAAGKGVVVAMTMEQATEALDDCMLHNHLGNAGAKVLIEEFIDGREASVMAIVDHDTVLPLVVSQDYKRLLDADEGPNTGGMGAITPTPVLADKAVENLVGEIFIPVISELYRRGIRYRGFLYAGVIVDRSGVVRVIEFNCRLGDPETQPLMMRLRSDLLAALDAAVSGSLKSVDLQWKNEFAACIVGASRGYPRAVDDNKEITGLFDADDRLVVFHAGTKLDPKTPGKVVSKGGRVLSVTALGATLDEAVARAYQGMEKISFDGMHYRKDIGQKKS